MHILTDENGNPIPHGHAAAAGDEHGHEGGQSTCPGHDHDHEHHHHEHFVPETKEQMAKLLEYMYKHNETHVGDLDKMTLKLEENGQHEAAEQVRRAADEFKKGNMYLSLARSVVEQS